MNPAGEVAIVGAGFSGTLLAINLLRFGGPRVTLIDREAGRIARGVAYSATHPSQLLNVRAAGMSAFPDDPGHFARWAEARGHGAQSFVPRSAYGAYLADTLADERARHGRRLSLREGDVVDLIKADGGYDVRFANGERLRADIVGLATGSLPPHTPREIDPALLPERAYVGDPWRADVAAGLGEGDTVVLLGSGLTAIDVALQLEAAGFGGRAIALSRRGLAPRRHLDGQPPAKGLRDPPDGPLSRLLADTRRRAEAQGWRAAVDALRPVTQRLWASSDADMRARFLRHLRPWWDVHRHRLAPAVADRIDAMARRGRLAFRAGKVTRAEPDGDGVRLFWRPRGGDAVCETRAARVINCTGPQGDLTRSDDPLLRALAARGVVRPDALRLGLDVDPQSRVLDVQGEPDETLCCVGPMTRGGLWEVVAVPDLRRQCWDVARRLANAQWVGGEGL